jgi:hypothetical protein
MGRAKNLGLTGSSGLAFSPLDAHCVAGGTLSRQPHHQRADIVDGGRALEREARCRQSSPITLEPISRAGFVFVQSLAFSLTDDVVRTKS